MFTSKKYYLHTTISVIFVVKSKLCICGNTNAYCQFFVFCGVLNHYGSRQNCCLWQCWCFDLFTKHLSSIKENCRYFRHTVVYISV